MINNIIYPPSYVFLIPHSQKQCLSPSSSLCGGDRKKKKKYPFFRGEFVSLVVFAA
jgi:hypothetical protein